MDTLQTIVSFSKQNQMALTNELVNSSPNWDQLPWISAILISLISFGINLLISRSQRKTSLEIASKQIEIDKEIATEQIKITSEQIQKDFSKTVLSGNRQNWINEFRDCVSRISAKSIIIGVKGSNNNYSDLEEFFFLLDKAGLMLNQNDDKKLIDLLGNVRKGAIDLKNGSHETEKKLIVARLSLLKETAKYLKSEWERVKKGE